MKAKIIFLTLVLAFAYFLPSDGENQAYRTIKLLNSGWIKGKVSHSIKEMEVPKIDTSRDIHACGSDSRTIEAVNIGNNGALRNVVVYLKDIKAGKEQHLNPQPPILSQEGCVFHPHVQVVPAHSSIKILNKDNILHSVHAFYYDFGTKFVLYPNSISYPAQTLFNIAMVAQRKESFQQVKNPGIVKIICESGHYWMSAYLVVAGHPYFAQVNSEGEYVLEDVPPGKYTLVSWHEYFGTIEKPVEVKANQPAAVDFVYTEEL